MKVAQPNPISDVYLAKGDAVRMNAGQEIKKAADQARRASSITKDSEEVSHVPKKSPPMLTRTPRANVNDELARNRTTTLTCREVFRNAIKQAINAITPARKNRITDKDIVNSYIIYMRYIYEC